MKQDQMQALETMKHTFIHSVQHEMRTPVSIIMGYADLLQSGSLGVLAEEQQQAVEAIVTQTAVLRTVVERITTLLDLEACGPAREPMTINDVVRSVVETHRQEAAQVGVSLTYDLAADLPLISGDPGYLRQAVECLVENGVKFTPSGGQVEVKAEAKGMRVNLSIVDTGIGIAQEKLDHIFDPFFQIDGSITRQYDGLGLGLAVAKTVIETHGGAIAVDSRPGQGSRFTITLPALTAPLAQAVAETKRRHRILIVDDEAFVAMTLQEGLEKLPNCEIEMATSGQEALQIIEQQPCDILITDYRMPDIDGLTLAGQIQQAHPETATIMITAYGETVLNQHSTEVAVTQVLDKPVKLADVRRVTSRVLADLPGSQPPTTGTVNYSFAG